MPPHQLDYPTIKTFLDNSNLDFRQRDYTPVETDGERGRVYSAPIGDGFDVVLHVDAGSDDEPEPEGDREIMVYIDHEVQRGQYNVELSSLPVTKDWRSHLRTQFRKAAERIEDLEHCEDCSLPMLKFNDYAGTFYACVSFNCENIVEVEPMDHRLANES